ncbi:unnamed protein product, partial [Prorocentrum cordatum]
VVGEFRVLIPQSYSIVEKGGVDLDYSPTEMVYFGRGSLGQEGVLKVLGAAKLVSAICAVQGDKILLGGLSQRKLGAVMGAIDAINEEACNNIMEHMPASSEVRITADELGDLNVRACCKDSPLFQGKFTGDCRAFSPPLGFPILASADRDQALDCLLPFFDVSGSAGNSTAEAGKGGRVFERRHLAAGGLIERRIKL